MEFLLYGVIMIIAMTMAGLIGFAANVIALPLLTIFLPLDTVVSMLVLLAAVQSAVQAFHVRKQIRWRELGHIVMFILIGMPFGFIFLKYLPELFTKAVLGIFIAVTAIKGIIENVRGKKQRIFKEKPWHKLLLVCSGFISGAYGCGGPLSVIYNSNRYHDKDIFRVMQFSCGTVSMSVACLVHIISGSYTVASIPYIVIGFIAVVVALRVSSYLVKRMDTIFFQQLVHVVLLLSAISLLWQVYNTL